MKETKLYAPEWYWKLPEDIRSKGRCGPGRGLGEKLIPETIWGLSVTPACQIHDQMYEKGETIGDKESADRVFLNNMLRIINGNSNRFMRWLRTRRALKYYEAVRDFGGPAFWSNKNKPEEMEVIK